MLTERSPRLVREDGAVLRDHRENLLDERRQVERTRAGRLEPSLHEKSNHGNALDEVRPESVGRRRFGADLVLLDVDPKDGCCSPASGTAEPLAHACHRGRRTDLPDAFNGSDIDAELEGCRRDDRGRPVP